MSVQIKFYFTDSTNITINQDRLASGSPSFSDSTSKTGSFEIGAAKINECQVMLRNIDGFFNEYEFYDSYFDVYIDDIEQGRYYTNLFTFSGGILTISGFDDMIKTEVPFNEIEINLPISADDLLDEVCIHCGIIRETTIFDNSDYIITRLPSSQDISCRQIISYIAQLSGNNARINNSRKLVIDWYDLPLILTGGLLDKINETEYTSGDDFDGNTDSFDGGTKDFGYEHIYKVPSANLSKDDILISGLEVHAMGTENDYGEKYLSGDESYVLIIKDNPLITEGNAQIICESIAYKIVGLKFRPMTINCISNYKIRAPKVAIAYIKGITYLTIINYSYYVYKKSQELSCYAEAKLIKKIGKGDEIETAVRIATKKTEQLLQGYKQSLQLLTSLMAYSSGAFPSEEKQIDGSSIFYLHDKKLLADSTNVWKINGNAFAVSSDGGQTWNAGLTAEGEFTSHAINTGLLRVDLIKAGSIITNEFEATNLKISGGSMDVETSDETSPSKIIFTNTYGIYKTVIYINSSGISIDYYENNILMKSVNTSPGSISVRHKESGIDSYFDLSGTILAWYFNDVLKFSMNSANGNLWVAGNVSALSFTDRP